MSANLCWLWPDRTIGKRESRVLREEHNKLANSHAELLAALELALSRAESDLRMWSVKHEGSVEHQSLTTAADKYRAAIAKAKGGQS